jgi:predicted nucleotidyltransferase
MLNKEKQRQWRSRRIEKYLSRLSLSQYRAIIFGSVARGDFIQESDTDLLIISDEFPQSIKARIDILFDIRDETPEIEPIGWREEEYQSRKAQGDPFLKILETEGVAWDQWLN